ncbi:MAG: hypothetical protein K9G67_03515 [Bacteroidales bacterium]|nr:hypothetical protein [Bacteroidales bacterium]MCF8352300.1 hypothetical protein [Bacteroidales bacterium]MCF8375399.1 hypothetical protein [Bacteroidales bacterium]
MKDIGYGQNYKYAHSHDGNFAGQEFLPDALSGSIFYQPGKNPGEEDMRKHLRKLWGKKYGYYDLFFPNVIFCTGFFYF